MNRKVKIESTRILLDDVFSVEEAFLCHTLEDGRMSARVRRLNFERGDSVAALVINRDAKTCVLVKQFRYPAYKRGAGWLVEIPAGIIERDEDPETSIRREILEEVGYRTGELIPVATFFPSPGGSSERILLHCAVVGNSDQIAKGGGIPEDQEAIEVYEISLDEIDQYLLDGRIADGKTLVALTWLQLRLAKGELL